MAALQMKGSTRDFKGRWWEGSTCSRETWAQCARGCTGGGDTLHITALASDFIHAFVHPKHMCTPGSQSHSSTAISIAVPNIMMGGFRNTVANLRETDFTCDIGTCLEICGTAVEYYLGNASGECPG